MGSEARPFFAPVPKVSGWRLFLKTVVARAYPRVVCLLYTSPSPRDS